MKREWDKILDKQILQLRYRTIEIEIARSFFQRLCGLMFKTPLTPSQGLLITPCSAIHTYGMQYPIDVIFLDMNFCILAIHPSLRPCHTASCKEASHVLELRAGQADAIHFKVGVQLPLSLSVEALA